MAESQDDKNVDDAITRMQALLDELKGAQKKDVADEAGDDSEEEGKESPAPKTFKEASVAVKAHFRRLRKAASQQ